MTTETATPARRARKAKLFNGHPSWNAWNVSLWLNNDEGLYNLMLECIRDAPNRRRAATDMQGALYLMGMDNTPDGAPYTVTNIRRAMVGV